MELNLGPGPGHFSSPEKESALPEAGSEGRAEVTQPQSSQRIKGGGCDFRPWNSLIHLEVEGVVGAGWGGLGGERVLPGSQQLGARWKAWGQEYGDRGPRCPPQLCPVTLTSAHVPLLRRRACWPSPRVAALPRHAEAQARLSGCRGHRPASGAPCGQFCHPDRGAAKGTSDLCAFSDSSLAPGVILSCLFLSAARSCQLLGLALPLSPPSLAPAVPSPQPSFGSMARPRCFNQKPKVFRKMPTSQYERAEPPPPTAMPTEGPGTLPCSET